MATTRWHVSAKQMVDYKLEEESLPLDLDDMSAVYDSLTAIDKMADFTTIEQAKLIAKVQKILQNSPVGRDILSRALAQGFTYEITPSDLGKKTTALRSRIANEKTTWGYDAEWLGSLLPDKTTLPKSGLPFDDIGESRTIVAEIAEMLMPYFLAADQHFTKQWQTANITAPDITAARTELDTHIINILDSEFTSLGNHQVTNSPYLRIAVGYFLAAHATIPALLGDAENKLPQSKAIFDQFHAKIKDQFKAVEPQYHDAIHALNTNLVTPLHDDLAHITTINPPRFIQDLPSAGASGTAQSATGQLLLNPDIWTLAKRFENNPITTLKKADDFKQLHAIVAANVNALSLSLSDTKFDSFLVEDSAKEAAELRTILQQKSLKSDFRRTAIPEDDLLSVLATVHLLTITQPPFITPETFAEKLPQTWQQYQKLQNFVQTSIEKINTEHAVETETVKTASTRRPAPHKTADQHIAHINASLDAFLDENPTLYQVTLNPDYGNNRLQFRFTNPQNDTPLIKSFNLGGITDIDTINHIAESTLWHVMERNGMEAFRSHTGRDSYDTSSNTLIFKKEDINNVTVKARGTGYIASLHFQDNSTIQIPLGLAMHLESSSEDSTKRVQELEKLVSGNGPTTTKLVTNALKDKITRGEAGLNTSWQVFRSESLPYKIQNAHHGLTTTGTLHINPNSQDANPSYIYKQAIEAKTAQGNVYTYDLKTNLHTADIATAKERAYATHELFDTTLTTLAQQGFTLTQKGNDLYFVDAQGQQPSPPLPKRLEGLYEMMAAPHKSQYQVDYDCVDTSQTEMKTYVIGITRIPADKPAKYIQSTPPGEKTRQDAAFTFTCPELNEKTLNNVIKAATEALQVVLHSKYDAKFSVNKKPNEQHTHSLDFDSRAVAQPFFDKIVDSIMQGLSLSPLQANRIHGQNPATIEQSQSRAA